MCPCVEHGFPCTDACKCKECKNSINDEDQSDCEEDENNDEEDCYNEDF